MSGQRRGAPELLAPAGGPEHLRAALAAGADAVYLGMRRFSMRVRASNFSVDELEAGCELAHRAGRRIYLAMNNLVFEGEWDACLRAVNEARGAGVDALIVQDLGLLHRLHRSIPELELHLSTQATVHHVEQLPFFADLGVRRVILAREMPLAQVVEAVRVGRALGLELECFVHGALCVSYSGQCLAGALLEGRSGNRGACPQLCRRAWSAEGEDLHERCLSLKDLWAVDKVKALADAGVASLKIEGRLKRPEFVYGMTRAYRRAIDAWTAGQDIPVATLEEELETLFHRGFTPGGLGDALALKETTRGQVGRVFPTLGRIEEIDGPRQRIRLSTTRLLAAGDALLFRSEGGHERSFFITRVFDEGKRPWLGVKGDGRAFETWLGAEVFLSTERARLEALHAAYAHWEAPERPLDMIVAGRVGEALELTVSSGEGASFSLRSSMPLGRADRRPLDGDRLRSQLGRLGGTGRCLRSLRVDLEGDCFLPVAELNRLRREAVEALVAAREAPESLASFLPLEGPRTISAKARLRVSCRSVEAMAAACDAGADELLLPPIPALWAEGASLPRLLLSPAITGPDGFDAFFAFLETHRKRVASVLAGNLAVARRLRAEGVSLWLDGSCNLANRAAVEAVKGLDPLGVTLARELVPRQWGPLVDGACLPVELILRERPPLFQLAMADFGRRCRSLRDDQGRSLAVRDWGGDRGATILGAWRELSGEAEPFFDRVEVLRVELGGGDDEKGLALLRSLRRRLDEARG